MVSRLLFATVFLPLLLIIVAFGLSACVQGQRATDTGDPGFPFGPTAVGVQPLSYVQDIKPVLDRDCLSCHGVGQARGNYSVATYATSRITFTPASRFFWFPEGTGLTLQYERYRADNGFTAGILSTGLRVPLNTK